MTELVCVPRIGGKWSHFAETAYLNKIKKKNFKGIRDEIRELKKILDADLDSKDQNLLTKKTLAAYKMAAINGWLRELIGFKK